MKKEDVVKFIQQNNYLMHVLNDICSQFTKIEKEVVEQYKNQFGLNTFYKSSFNNYENPYDHSEYLFIMSDKYSDGIMSLEGDNIVVTGYVDSYDFGLDTYVFYVDIDLVENYDNKEYLTNRINKIVSAKIENEYRKSKKLLEDEQKRQEELENRKKDEDYQLYLKLKKKFGDNFEILLRR